MNREKKIVTGISASILIGVLIFLKYFNFFGSNINGLINNLFGLTPIPTLSLMLPLGISFYTLQAVSYITDVYRGTVKADKNLFRVCLFLTFFPQLIEGPICRYSQTAESLYNGNDYDSKNIVSGFQLIIWGLFKKIIIADRLNVLVNQVFSNYSNYGGAIIAISVLCYTIQLYCDFSGCMDIVRGSGELFGIIIPKNFERPFFPAVFPSSGEGGISRWEHGLKTIYSTLFLCRLLSRNLASFQETISATVPENLYRQSALYFSFGSAPVCGTAPAGNTLHTDCIILSL